MYFSNTLYNPPINETIDLHWRNDSRDGTFGINLIRPTFQLLGTNHNANVVETFVWMVSWEWKHIFYKIAFVIPSHAGLLPFGRCNNTFFASTFLESTLNSWQIFVFTDTQPHYKTLVSCFQDILIHNKLLFCWWICKVHHEKMEGHMGYVF